MNVDKFGRYTYTGMSIDKFGRHTSTERLRGPKGEGFKMTEDKSGYDIDNKRLTNVADPLDENDGVNLKTLQTHTSPCLKLNNKSEYDIDNKRLTNIADPLHENDGVNLKTLQTHTSPCLKLNDENVFDVNGKRITNAIDPVDSNDVVIKKYLHSRIPIKIDPLKSYSFHQFTIQDVGPPMAGGDAVTLKYLTDNTLVRRGYTFSASNKRIANLAKPIELDDAVNKQYLKSALGDLAYVVYKGMHKGRSSIVPADVWKQKVLESSWEDLFSDNALWLIT